MKEDILGKLAAVRDLVSSARSMPMSASVVVNRSELLAGLDGLESQIHLSMTEASALIGDRSAVVSGGQAEADELLRLARQKQDDLVSDTEVYKLAQRRAQDVADAAAQEAEGLRKETDEYVDHKLASFEVTLEKTIEAVRRGRSRLAETGESDGFDSDEVDRIRLPEHLER